MTIIAFDGKTIAADSQLSDSDEEGHVTSRTSSVAKLVELGHGWVLGMTGDNAIGVIVADALAGQMQDEAPTAAIICDLSEEIHEEDDVSGILVHVNHGAYYIEATRKGHIVLTRITQEFAVAGSGAVAALAAMMANATAVQAVQITCELMPCCGPPIMMIELDNITQMRPRD